MSNEQWSGPGRRTGVAGRRAKRTVPALAGLAAIGLAVTAGAVPAASAHAALPARAHASSSGGIIVDGISETINTLDIANFTSEGSTFVNLPLFSDPLNYANYSSTGCASAGFPPQLTASNLVSKWSIADHGKKYTFVLNPAAKSPYGNSVNATDAKWSLDRMLKIDPLAQFLWYNVAGLSKTDPITIDGPEKVTYNFSSPTTLSAAMLQFSGWAAINDYKSIKKHITAKDPWAKTWLATHVDNFGPWMVKSYQPNKVVYAPNPGYNGPRGNVKELIIETISNPSTLQELLASGQVTVGNGLTLQQVRALKSNKHVDVVSCSSSFRDYMGENIKDPILGKQAVRQAISLALNRSAITRSVYAGFALPSSAGVSTTFHPTGGTSNFKFDPAKAKQLLTSAGYPNGFTMTLSISPGQPGPYVQDLATAIQSDLAAIGVTVNINTVASSTEFAGDLSSHKLQAFLASETPAFYNPGYSELIWGSCNGLVNEEGSCFKGMDAVSNALLHVTNLKKAASLVNRLSNDYNTYMPQIYIADIQTPEPRNVCLRSLPLSPYNAQYQLADSTCTS